MPGTTTVTPVLLKFDKTLGEELLKDIRTNCSALVVHEKNLWIGGDEGTFVDRLTREPTGNFGQHRRFDLRPLLGLVSGDKTEVDIEGLDVDGGYLWVVGSHSLKRKKADDKKSAADNFTRLADVTLDPNRLTLGRVPLKKNGSDFEPTDRASTLTAARLKGDARGNLLTQALESDPHIGPFVPRFANGKLVGIPSKDNGLDVEGLAASGNRVFVGLRGPVLRGWSVVLELLVSEAAAGVLALQAIGPAGAPYRKHFLDLDGLGVRDLAIDGKDLYILAGPTMDLDGPVFIYRWGKALDHTSNALVFGKDLEKKVTVPFGENADHAEGMSLVDLPLSAMVCYDSPSKDRVKGDDKDGVQVDIFRL